MAYAYRTIVTIEGRSFAVHYNADGEVLRINERKSYTQFGVLKDYETSYWSARSHVLGSGLTMPKRIIEKARQKMTSEDRAHDATP